MQGKKNIKLINIPENRKKIISRLPVNTFNSRATW